MLNGGLSFVYRKTYRYNRPIYYDSAAMKENKDDEAFDIKKSEITETRSYFEKGNFIQQTQNSHSQLTGFHLLEERERIMTSYNKLRAMVR